MSNIPPKTPLHQKPRRYTEKRQFQNYKERRPSSDFSALVDTIKSEGRAYRKEEQREDQGKKFREWITIGFIGLTFIAICYQVHEMIKVYEPIRDQAIATDESAKATTRAANAATKQSEIATRQADSSDRAAIQAQRAWVGPSIVKIEGALEADKPIEISINYANSGREPALNFIYAIDVFATTAEEDGRGVAAAKTEAHFKGCRDAKSLRPGQVIFPNAANSLTMTKDKIVDQAVIDGDKTVIINGCFLYKSFEIVRRTYFCYFYKAKATKPSNLNICTSGSGAD